VEQAWIDELREFISIPSVSADPAHRDDVLRAADWLAELVKRSGGEAEVTPFGERELVLGEIPASAGNGLAPTVMVYGHFDVQPPAPLDLWDSPPFELDERDGWYYARGIADDKGQLYTLVKAAQLLALAGELPVNIRFACDGEEEIGGHTIVDFLEHDERGAEAALVFDGVMLGRDMPVFQTAKRGLIRLDVTVRTGEQDLHSGLYGGAALNAMHALMQSLSSVLPRGARLPEPLRAGILPPSDEELAAWAKLPAGAGELDRRGARPVDLRAAAEFYVRTWAEPSVDVHGIVSEGAAFRRTIIPAVASARLSIRLAPGQDVDTVGAAAERMLREVAPPGAELDIRWDGTPPALVPADAPALQLGLDAFERAFGVRPLLVRGGGTLPAMGALSKRGISVIRTGFGLPESNVHAPNERIPVEYLDRAVRTARELYTELARLPSRVA
jgi:acetylornithine deacetylase/succinyl-diaminopimelate desuccinylase-like protein